jgi:hypothetical protein
MELLRFIQRKWNRTPSPQYFVPYKDKAAVTKDFKKTLTHRFLSMFKRNSELNEGIKDAIIEETITDEAIEEILYVTKKLINKNIAILMIQCMVRQFIARRKRFVYIDVYMYVCIYKLICSFASEYIYTLYACIYKKMCI